MSNYPIYNHQSNCAGRLPRNDELEKSVNASAQIVPDPPVHSNHSGAEVSRGIVWLRSWVITAAHKVMRQCADLAKRFFQLLFVEAERSPRESRLQSLSPQVDIDDPYPRISGRFPPGDPFVRHVAELAQDCLRPHIHRELNGRIAHDEAGIERVAIPFATGLLSPELASPAMQLRRLREAKSLRPAEGLNALHHSMGWEDECELRHRIADFLSEWVDRTQVHSPALHQCMQQVANLTTLEDDFARVKCLRSVEELFADFWADHHRVCQSLQRDQPLVLSNLEKSMQSYSKHIGPVLDAAVGKLLRSAVPEMLAGTWGAFWALLEPMPKEQERDVQRYLAGQGWSFASLGITDAEGLELCKVLPLQALCIAAPRSMQTPHQLWLALLCVSYRLTWSLFLSASKQHLVEKGAFFQDLREGKAIDQAFLHRMSRFYLSVCLTLICAIHYAHRLSYSVVGQSLGWGALGLVGGLWAKDDVDALLKNFIQVKQLETTFVQNLMSFTYLLLPLMAYLCVTYRNTPLWKIEQLLQFVQRRSQVSSQMAQVEIEELDNAHLEVAEIAQSIDDSISSPLQELFC